MFNWTAELNTMVIQKLFEENGGDEAVANKMECRQTVEDAVGPMEGLQNHFTYSVARLRDISIILAKKE
jgi:hypothetical protein